MLCLIASSGQESLVVPLWVHEAVVMHPTTPPEAEIWVTVALHVESHNGSHGEFSLVHPGSISKPEDKFESLFGEEEDWINYSINHTKGRKIKTSDDGNSLVLEHDIKGPLPMTMWGELEYALKPVFPIHIGATDGGTITTWPDAKLIKQVQDSGCDVPFTQVSLDIPRSEGRNLCICRLCFKTGQGIRRAGIPGQFVFPAYGPNEMVSEIREALRKLPNAMQEPFLHRYRQATKGFREIQYDVTMLGCPHGHTYIVDWGDEHRATPMFTVKDPTDSERSRQVFSFTPRHLSFRLQVLAVPASVQQ